MITTMTPPPPLLAVSHLGVRFGGVRAVDDVSFEVRRGEVFTLIGPNGAGKTTVFNLISRLYTPSAGSIEFDGQPLLACAPHAAQVGARHRRYVAAFEHDAAARRLHQPQERPAGRRFAASGLAHEAERLSLADVEADIVDGADPAEAHAEVRDDEKRRRGRRHLSRSDLRKLFWRLNMPRR